MLYVAVLRLAANVAKLDAIVIPPAALVIVTLDPAVSVATDGNPLVALPISRCPFVDIAAVAATVS